MDTLQLKRLTKSFLNKALNRNGGEFSRRMSHRHHTFWHAADAEQIRNKPMAPDAPMSEWKAGINWQRKLSNKYNARLFAQMHGCKVPQLFWKGRDLDQIDFDKLPKQFVIRPTIGFSCNMVYLIDNQYNHMDKQTYTNDELLTKLTAALTENPYQEFLIEEFLKTEQGEYKIPVDYKLYMFNGHVAVIYVINRESPKSGTSANYDENWNMIPDIGKVYEVASYQEPPECLPEIIDCAKKLSKTYETFVRIDFYATDKGAVFGEFTPTPGMGRNFTPEGEKLLVKYWDEYCAEMI